MINEPWAYDDWFYDQFGDPIPYDCFDDTYPEEDDDGYEPHYL